MRSLSSTGDEVHGLNHSQLEIGSPDSVQSVLSANQAGRGRQLRRHFTMWNTASSNLPKPSPSMRAELATWLRSAASSGALLIHISTDYVFDGGKGTPLRRE